MAHVRKLRSGLWQATVRHPSGDRFSKSDPLKKVVQTWAADEEAKIRRGEWVNPHAGKVTLADWQAKWQQTRRVEVATREKTDSWWRNHVEPKFGSWPLASIQSWDVEAWVSELESRGVGAETARSSLRLLRQILRDAVKHRLLTVNPADGVRATPPPPHIDRVLTRDEADRLLAQFSGEDRVFVSLLLYCGLRFQEAAGLRRFRVDLLRKRLQVAKVQPRKGTEKRPKTDAGVRLVPLTDELVVSLSQLIPAPDDGLVFTSPNGGRIYYGNWLTRVWYPALYGAPAVEAKRAVRGRAATPAVPARPGAKLPDPQPTPHDLRHTYGSWLGEAGMPEGQIAALMGHASRQSVARYVHATEARFDQARAALGAAGERQEQPPQAYPGVPK
ncbi:site-specific integrase [Streptomyces sp.]|uniref:tyrosine-type recombinase/integrase n=1 Tax=Streptomyces sp. TaxID=1931 RepID=UPI002F95EB04